MVTARDVITAAQKDCGVLGIGQTMNAEDTNDALIRLQNMVATWQQKRWMQPSLFDIKMPGNNEQSNQIGNGQYWNTPRPDKIRAAYFVQTNSSQVSFPLWPINSYEEYAKISLKELNSFPTRFFYDQAYPYGNVFIWPIPSSSYEIHLIIPSQLGFSTTIDNVLVTDVGSGGYTNGDFPSVPLINVSSTQNGISATARVIIVGGVINDFIIENGGELYRVNDLLYPDTAIVGPGNGIIKVLSTESNLDSEMSFPPEYQEALIYNLSLRLSAMYQLEASRDTRILARSSLKTIIAANTMIPVLGMPGLLPRTSRGGRTGIVNANGGIVWADVA